MFEEFYLSVYHDFFFQWILLNKDSYLKDQVICEVQQQNDKFQSIIFTLPQVKGIVTIWYNHIVEEEIYRQDDQMMLFYLHYTITNLNQCRHLFLEFYQTLIKYSYQRIYKIALCCTGGLSTFTFVEEMKKVCELENVPFQLDSLSLEQLYDQYLDYDALYLAPQIAHMEAQLLIETKHQVPLFCIDPTLFATKDYIGIVKYMKKTLKMLS